MELSIAAQRLDRERSASGFLSVASDVLSTAGLGQHQLFAIDHEIRYLVSLSEPHEIVEVTDEIFRSITSSEDSTAGKEWIALPGRQEPLLVARLEDEASTFDRAIGALIGELYAQRRTKRFDLERPRRQSHMSVAAEMQWDLLPPPTDANDLIALAAALRPAYDVAGDAFDYQVDDGFVRAYAFDAMGHGTTATLSAALATTAIRNARFRGADLAGQFDAAHRAVQDQWGGDLFVTGVGIEVTADRVYVVNAGHEPIRRRLVNGSIETLQIPADPPLGSPHSDGYRTLQIDRLLASEGLVLLSDGAPNNRNSDGSSLGEPGVNQTLRDCWDPIPFVTVHRFLNRVNERLDMDEVDDITALVLVAK